MKQHHREEKGLAVGSTAPLDSKQMETPESMDVNMNFFAPLSLAWEQLLLAHLQPPYSGPLPEFIFLL